MNPRIERPLDLLNSLKGESVLVSLKNNKEEMSGNLIAFDININLVLDIKGKLTFIRGDNIISIC